jgi:predicted ATP-grasp superfamily ATP-dependent carboligase
MVLQEYIPGHDSQGLNYNCYFWDGSPLVEFTAQKVMNAPPYLGSPCAVRSRPLAEVAEAVEAGRRLLSAGRLNGFACTEFKRDPRDGIYKLMEVNVRHNLSAELAIHCGVNFPWLQYRHLVEGRLPEPQGFKAGVSWIDLARYLKNCVRHFGSEFSLTQFLRLFLQPHVFADLHWSDPRPFARKLIRRRIRRAEVARPSIAEPQGQPGMLV